MISLTSLTASSSFDRLSDPGRTVRHTVAPSRRARRTGRGASRFGALSWVAGGVVVAALVGGIAAAVAVPPQHATLGPKVQVAAKSVQAR